jgi:hypothetical protein
MDFKFKDKDEKAEDKAVENEAAEIKAPDYDFGEQEGEETKVEENATLEPYVGESEAAGGATLESYAGESDTVEDDVRESEGTGVQVAGGGTVESEPAPTRPKYRIPTEKEDAARNSFKIPFKQILLVIVLLGGGYYVKTYHGKENKPTRIANPPVAEIQKPTPKVSSLEEIPGLLNESKELFQSIKEQKNRQNNQASARRSSGNASPRQINLQALKNYKGQWVTILMKDGLEREGRIVDVKEKIVHIEQDFQYGTISVRIPIQKIADVRK